LVKINPVEKESLLIVARNYVQLKEGSEPISLEQYNKEIDEAMKEMDEGEFYTHEAVVAASKTWLNGK
jgi:predicted transcriptional regulator